MNRSVKIWLSAAAVLILAGLLLFAGVMTINGWDFNSLAHAEFEADAFVIAVVFDSISILSDTPDIRFLPSDSGTCRVVFYAHAKADRSASVLDGILHIQTADTRKWYEQISLQFSTPRISVFLPGNEYASLSIEGGTGDVDIPKDFRFKGMQITVSTGDISCSASSAEPVRIKTSTGNIRLENMSAGALGLSVSTGRVELRSVVCERDADVAVSTGKTVLSEVSCRNFSSAGSVAFQPVGGRPLDHGGVGQHEAGPQRGKSRRILFGQRHLVDELEIPLVRKQCLRGPVQFFVEGRLAGQTALQGA